MLVGQALLLDCCIHSHLKARWDNIRTECLSCESAPAGAGLLLGKRLLIVSCKLECFCCQLATFLIVQPLRRDRFVKHASAVNIVKYMAYAALNAMTTGCC